MMRNLLVCGLIAGVCAGLLATGFARVVGEPAVEAAIAFEESHAEPAAEPAGTNLQHAAGPLVSRKIQSSAGLLTASLVYGLALGGLFALAFAFVYGRIVHLSPAATALCLAAASFVVVFLVPFLKYPANPPAVGNPDTITRRTLLYFAIVGVSLAAAVLAVRLRRLLAERGARAATVAGVAAFVVVVLVAGLALPGIQEVPADFPAVTLWEFRQATVATQFVLWTTLGAIFALGARRAMTGRGAAKRSVALTARAGD